ncbi:hypothetical protein J6590_067980 [Homalodisca vitripennis]|nr:hypothetical protein J6590_067980 [Homalodisca vitripennis]
MDFKQVGTRHYRTPTGIVYNESPSSPTSDPGGTEESGHRSGHKRGHRRGPGLPQYWTVVSELIDRYKL